MDIDFYVTKDDPRKIEKTVTEKKTVTGVFTYDNFSILTPSFLLSYDSDILSKNVFYSGVLNRWYAITNISLIPGGKMVVSGKVDVLLSFNDEILKCKGNAVRSSSSGFTMVPDTAYPILPGKEYVSSFFLSDSDLDPPAILPPNEYRFVLTLKK